LQRVDFLWDLVPVKDSSLKVVDDVKPTANFRFP